MIRLDLPTNGKNAWRSPKCGSYTKSISEGVYFVKIDGSINLILLSHSLTFANSYA